MSPDFSRNGNILFNFILKIFIKDDDVVIVDGSFPNKHVSSHYEIMICGLAAFL